ncbi:MAG: GAF domain-containing protein [Candidatus Delongbacteria bacterium]|nr:GAF domain-containing protein [Candidatus Delongbacteria bacterium]MBN2833805.1 GAF domain-containing protein [Candidatus Delongbacteria bacterium]
MTNYKDMVFALNEIGISLSSEKNQDVLLKKIVNSIVEFVRCDACSLFIKENDPERLIFKASRTVSLNNSSFSDTPVNLSSNSIAGYTAIYGEIINIKDCYNISEDYPFSFNRSYDHMSGYRTVSMISVPMRDHKGRIIGVLQIINKLDDEGRIIEFESEFEKIAESLASQAGVAISNVTLLNSNKNLYKSLVNSFSEAIEARSPHTAGHSKRVTWISMLLAEAVSNADYGTYADTKFTKDELEELRFSAVLHDVGKISIPEKILEKSNKLTEEEMAIIAERFEAIRLSILRSIGNGGSNLIEDLNSDHAFLIKKSIPGKPLNDEELERIVSISRKKFKLSDGTERNYLKPLEVEKFLISRGSFTKEEYEIMKLHVVHTADILNEIPFTDELKNVREYAAKHHELLDGSGYPNGLKGDDIPLQSRIMTISDIFEALTAADRPYKKSQPIDITLRILNEEADKGRLDKDLVDIFIREEVYEKYLEKKNRSHGGII